MKEASLHPTSLLFAPPEKETIEKLIWEPKLLNMIFQTNKNNSCFLIFFEISKSHSISEISTWFLASDLNIYGGQTYK